jgi:anaerobic magnesium-protoporphyrin IX monomethyl ester cyclase
MKILFIEPPKDFYFIMGDYLPPPYGIIQLAAYIEREVKETEIEILDCNAQNIQWNELERQIESSNPDVVASSSLATCNTYAVVRTLDTAKKANPEILTVTGGQHFTAMAQESLKEYPVIDVIVRGEGEQTLAELAVKGKDNKSLPGIKGISFQRNGEIMNNPPRPLIEDLNQLPYPGYHLVKDLMSKYHFTMMAGRDSAYALIEGSRGCSHECSFCTQWRHWQGRWRLKSPKRIADEMEYCYRNFGSKFVWLTDDNFGAGTRPRDLANEIIKNGTADEKTWFVQARCDDIVRCKEDLPKLRESGLTWVLLGVENPEQTTLEAFKKEITPNQARAAVKLLKDNRIFAHVMLIIGGRKDTKESIRKVAEFANDLDPDFAMFSVLTPLPGTETFEQAKRNGWLEDNNWSHYDMVHAIMPTETLSTAEIQEELYKCYRSFYGPLKRRFQGFFSKNKMKQRVFRHMARRALLTEFKNLFTSNAN